MIDNSNLPPGVSASDPHIAGSELIELTRGYSLLDGVIVDVDEEPVEIDHCNCDMDYLCPNAGCIDRQMKDEAYYTVRSIPVEWREFMEARKESR